MSPDAVPLSRSEAVPLHAEASALAGEALIPTRSPSAHGRATLTMPAGGPGVCPSSSPGKSLIGYKFDDFELLAELGQGGMGIVYKARQISLDRLVAVKMLRQEHFASPTVVQRFLAEARAVAALDHPNIVKIYQVGNCSAGRYFVMAFVDGQPLEAMLAKGPLPIGGSTLLLLRVAEAVHHAHSKGIIHRDLKPANILINQLGQPVVLDFGIVKFMDCDANLTQEGMILGTPTYLPPEQGGQGSDAKVGPYSDVYSLGAILYTMLAGRAPYDGKTAVEVLIQVMSPDPPTPLRELRPEIPTELERICMKCLHKQPEDRYASAMALVEDLRHFRDRSKAPRSLTSTSLHPLPPVLLVMVDTGQGVRLPGPRTVLGRAPECDVLLSSAAVSKRHCQILWQNGRAVLEDLHSSNGTWRNGQRVRRCQLEDGDRLEVGGHRVVVRMVSRNEG
jgi:serine/threonine protein kinase